MKKKINRVQLFLLGAVLIFSACANPTQAIKPDLDRFKREYPDHIVSYDFGKQKMQYAWSGDLKKRPLIFVHGSPGSWEGWAHFLLDPELQQNFHVIAVDRPGYGGSGKGDTERSLQKQSEAILEVLKFNQSGKSAFLVGHSYGGPVVARMAMDHPEKIAGVVFAASSVDPGQEKTKWFQYPGDWWPIRDLIPSDLKVCNQEIFALKSELIAMMSSWSSFKPSAVIIQGEDDDLVPPENLKFLTEHLRSETVLKIYDVPELNHFIPWKRPDLILSGIQLLSKHYP